MMLGDAHSIDILFLYNRRRGAAPLLPSVCPPKMAMLERQRAAARYFLCRFKFLFSLLCLMCSTCQISMLPFIFHILVGFITLLMPISPNLNCPALLYTVHLVLFSTSVVGCLLCDAETLSVHLATCLSD